MSLQQKHVKKEKKKKTENEREKFVVPFHWLLLVICFRIDRMVAIVRLNQSEYYDFSKIYYSTIDIRQPHNNICITAMIISCFLSLFFFWISKHKSSNIKSVQSLKYRQDSSSSPSPPSSSYNLVEFPVSCYFMFDFPVFVVIKMFPILFELRPTNQPTNHFQLV